MKPLASSVTTRRCCPLSRPSRKRAGSSPHSMSTLFLTFSRGSAANRKRKRWCRRHWPNSAFPLPAVTLRSSGWPWTKPGSRKFLKQNGIPTPDFQLISPQTLDTFRLGYPCIVKPRGEDASHGISADSLVQDFASLERQVKAITRTYRSGSLVEQFIGGREFNATVMGNARCEVLPVSEIVYALAPDMPRILTFAAKWEPDSVYFKGTKVICPAEVSDAEREYIASTALKAFKLVVGRGYARMDMRMDEAGKLNIIEVNPNPDISPDTGAARQSAAAGMKYAEFIERIINLALEKEKHGRKNPPHVRRRQTGVDADTAKYARI